MNGYIFLAFFIMLVPFVGFFISCFFDGVEKTVSDFIESLYKE